MQFRLKHNKSRTHYITDILFANLITWHKLLEGFARSSRQQLVSNHLSENHM